MMRRAFVFVFAVTCCAGLGLAADAPASDNEPFVIRSADEPADGAVQACASMTQTLRSAVELYKLQHGDKYPTTSGKPIGSEWDWKLLTQVTTGSDGKKCGPYLQAPIRNPVANSSEVVSEPKKGAGWLLDRDGLLFPLNPKGEKTEYKAVPVPLEPNKSVRLHLVMLDYVVSLYKRQHNDQYPTKSGKPIASEWDWDLLTKRSTSDRGRAVGPYLPAAPVNALTGSSRVVGKAEKSAGWILTEDGHVQAVAQDGTVFREDRP